VGIGVAPAGEAALHVLAVRVGRVAVVHVLGVLVERPPVFALGVGRVDPALGSLVSDEEINRLGDRTGLVSLMRVVSAFMRPL
jgi:hypothetical protein